MATTRKIQVRHPARIGAALAATAAIALGAPAAPALAGGFTLSLASEADAVVGRPLIIQATGTIPPQDIGFPYWFSLDAISTGFTTTCPQDRWVGAQFAQGSGGSIVVLTQSEQPDVGGNFAIPVAVTPSAPGSVLFCAYTDDGAAATLASASLIVNIQPAPSSRPGADSRPTGEAGGGSRPPSPPAYAVQGIRGCKALFGGSQARSCIRDILRKANARCRRRHSGGARARCLQAVRRAAKRS